MATPGIGGDVATAVAAAAAAEGVSAAMMLAGLVMFFIVDLFFFLSFFLRLSLVELRKRNLLPTRRRKIYTLLLLSLFLK